jgi:hypothetical protein
LEDETGQSQYHGHLEGAQSATYYLLMKEKKEFVAIPAGSWYASCAKDRVCLQEQFSYDFCLFFFSLVNFYVKRQ